MCAGADAVRLTPAAASSRAVAKVRIVVEPLLARGPLRAETGAGVPVAPRSFGAAIPVDGLRDVVVSPRTDRACGVSRPR